MLRRCTPRGRTAGLLSETWIAALCVKSSAYLFYPHGSGVECVGRGAGGEGRDVFGQLPSREGRGPDNVPRGAWGGEHKRKEPLLGVRAKSPAGVGVVPREENVVYVDDDTRGEGGEDEEELGKRVPEWLQYVRRVDEEDVVFLQGLKHCPVCFLKCGFDEGWARGDDWSPEWFYDGVCRIVRLVKRVLDVFYRKSKRLRRFTGADFYDAPGLHT